MLQPLSILFLIVLAGLLGTQLITAFFSKDRSMIWSPLTFISGTLVYYIILPSIFSVNEYRIDFIQDQWIFYLSSVVFYFFVLLGYQIRVRGRFHNWNKLINHKDAFFYGVILFIIALICYIPFRGFRTTIWASDATLVTERTGFVSYFIDLISLLCASCGLLFIGCRERLRINRWLILGAVLYLTFVIYVVGGFRFRFVYLLLMLFTIYHLYGKPRRINLFLILAVFIPMYLLFAAMENSRNYGQGLDKEALQEISFEDMESGAKENASVLYFSMLCTDYYNRNNENIGFEPIVNAVFMPFPRAMFPWKPDGHYIRDVQIRTLGSSDSGAAFLNFTEGFISFGWLGVALYGLILGLLSSLFWRNYLDNRDSTGAILLLALFNGFCYQWISRGYLGGNFNSFIYFVAAPFWLLSLIRFFTQKILSR